ncbi:unnamed protein product [Effrenium voratum]|uniref:Uncharacterized protein n=1 Tax=Effrenium voratum TaxID=2562239 RepID=A0AA36NI76_9DINO|nr:unnamed protein product [Effrenium voratum]
MRHRAKLAPQRLGGPMASEPRDSLCKAEKSNFHMAEKSECWPTARQEAAASPSHFSQKSYQPITIPMTASQGSLYPGTGSVNVPQPIMTASPRRSPSLPTPISPHSAMSGAAGSVGQPQGQPASGHFAPHSGHFGPVISMSGQFQPHSMRSHHLSAMPLPANLPPYVTMR